MLSLNGNRVSVTIFKDVSRKNSGLLFDSVDTHWLPALWQSLFKGLGEAIIEITFLLGRQTTSRKGYGDADATML